MIQSRSFVRFFIPETAAMQGIFYYHTLDVSLGDSGCN